MESSSTKEELLNSVPTDAPAKVTVPVSARASNRVVSIDVLRGFDMFWLMGGRELVIALTALFSVRASNAFVGFSTHADWEGFHFWDFIAPLFLFVVGLSMPFSFARRLERGASRGDLYRHILRRTAMLILLGWFTNGWLDLNFSHIRFTGVLVRIALAYVIAALIFARTSLRGQILWTAGLLLGHWAVVALIPVPGFGAGVYTIQGNFSGFLDRMIPGGHCCAPYVPYGDNMGPLGSFPAAGTVLLGALCGRLLRSALSGKRKLLFLVAGGGASLALGWLWSFALPIITKMWTGSYVLWANGWSMLLFALFYWIVDLRGYRRWAFFFVVIGMNALVIYVLPIEVRLNDIANIFLRGVIHHAGAYAPLISAAGYVAVAWLILYFMYRKKIFWSV